MSTVHPTSKTCTACGQDKPLTEYYAHKKGRDGRRAQCKTCVSHERNEYAKRKRRENPELVRQRARENYARNGNKYQAQRKEYSRNHQWMSRYKYRRLRAEAMGAPVVDLTTEQWLERLTYFDTRCAFCHEPLTEDGQDHIVPLTRGGSHTLDNVVPVCRACNARKWKHSLLECLMKGKL